MENSDGIWQWCGARKKLFTMRKIHSIRVKNFIAEVRKWRFEEESTSATDSDTVPDQLLQWPLGIADEKFVQKKRTWKSKAGRRGQKAALTKNRLFSDEGMTGNSGQVEASKVLAEDMELQSQNMNGDTGDLRLVARKKHKRNQSLVSEESEILFPGLHVLADVAVWCLENDVVGSPENNLREEKGISIPTGVPFLQNRVHRITKSPSAPLTVDNIYKQGVPAACIKQIENEVPQAVRCSKRTRSQALPSKYRDYVL